ncbi:MAG: hypothetical protein ACE5Z5_07865 [Candidatus Bathyarchaeia archaeon]
MVRALVPPVWLGKRLAVLGRKLSDDCRTCPILEFENTCRGFQRTFQEAYGDVKPKPCPWLIVALGRVGMRVFRGLGLFDGLEDCRTCELRGFCLASCESFEAMYQKALHETYGLEPLKPQ